MHQNSIIFYNLEYEYLNIVGIAIHKNNSFKREIKYCITIHTSYSFTIYAPKFYFNLEVEIGSACYLKPLTKSENSLLNVTCIENAFKNA